VYNVVYIQAGDMNCLSVSSSSCQTVGLSIAHYTLLYCVLASPKAKQKLVDSKITHILSIHDAAEPGDGVSCHSVYST